MIKIKVIGTGSKGNSYLLDNGESRILLDCGAKRVIKENFSNIRGVVITHIHGDHTSQIGKIDNYYNGKYYSHKDVLDILPVIDNKKVEVKTGDKFDIGTFSCTCFELAHDVKCYGYLIKDTISGYKLVYITDTGYINYQFKDIDCYLIESNCDEDLLTYQDYKEVRVYNTHLSMQQTANFLKENTNHNTKHVVLCHISQNESDIDKHKHFIEKELNNENIKVIALNPHMLEPIEIKLKEDLEFNFD